MIREQQITERSRSDEEEGHERSRELGRKQRSNVATSGSALVAGLACPILHACSKRPNKKDPSER